MVSALPWLGEISKSPLSTHCGHFHYAMDRRGIIVVFVGVILVFLLMFYSGMFMHGD